MPGSAGSTASALSCSWSGCSSGSPFALSVVTTVASANTAASAACAAHACIPDCLKPCATRTQYGRFESRQCQGGSCEARIESAVWNLHNNGLDLGCACCLHARLLQCRYRLLGCIGRQHHRHRLLRLILQQVQSVCLSQLALQAHACADSGCVAHGRPSHQASIIA